jgi:hypothetical protein
MAVHLRKERTESGLQGSGTPLASVPVHVAPEPTGFACSASSLNPRSRSSIVERQSPSNLGTLLAKNAVMDAHGPGQRVHPNQPHPL